MTDSSHIALITGANRGIGRSTALALARAGVDSIITYHSHADEAQAVVEQIAGLGRAAVALQLDVGDVGSFDTFVGQVAQALRDTWDRETVDSVVNNGGMQVPMSFADATEEGFDRLIDVQFKGVFFLTQKLVDLIADGGAIVNVSSAMTRFYVPQRIVYSASKAAVETLTPYLAQELAPRGIRVNTVAPGATATDFSGGLLRDNEQVQQAVTAVTALGRLGHPDEIGDAIAALLSDASRWVTGQRLEVSGGVHL